MRLFSATAYTMILAAVLALPAAFPPAFAQTVPQASSVVSPQRAIEMAAQGNCSEALPSLRSASRITDKQLRYRATMARARCAMSLDNVSEALVALSLLRSDFPDDAEVLYLSAHYFSQLSDRSAQHLAETAPSSPQMQKLRAESLESQNKWDEAIEIYRHILEQDPRSPEIHYRIAQALLAKPSYPAQVEDARKELSAELDANPQNASAEFVLGELARREADWDSAISHFSRAAKLDAGFSEANLALGMSMNGANRFAEAVAPLQRYVKMEPDDPAGHYQLSLAYSRTGNKAAAEREAELQRKAAERAPANAH